jgi:hypothetical protein
MTDPIELPLDSDDRLADAPLLDSLHYERGPDGFAVTFVPSVGLDATHSLFIPRDSAEGRQVSAYIYRVEDLIGSRVAKVVHRGGSDYTLHLADGRITTLSEGHSWTMEVFDRLKQVAMSAEFAFQLAHVPGK